MLIQISENNEKHVVAQVHRKLDILYRWVVPRAICWQIVKLCHDDLGHFGIEKTLAKIQENYWFAGMQKICQKKYVNA